MLGSAAWSPSRTAHAPPTITSRTADPGANRCESSRASRDRAVRLGCSGSSTTRSARKPGAIRPAGLPGHVGPALQSGVPQGLTACGLLVACRCHPSEFVQALTLLEQPKLGGGIGGHVAVRADAVLPPMRQMLGQWEYSVAEIGLG